MLFEHNFPLCYVQFSEKSCIGAQASIITIKQALFKTNKPTNISFLLVYRAFQFP